MHELFNLLNTVGKHLSNVETNKYQYSAVTRRSHRHRARQSKFWDLIYALIAILFTTNEKLYSKIIEKFMISSTYSRNPQLPVAVTPGNF